MRCALAWAVLLAACGGQAAGQPPTRGPTGAADAAGPAFDGSIPSPPQGFSLSIPRPNGQTDHLEVTAGGELFRWVTPSEHGRPSAPAAVRLHADWSIRTQGDERLFQLRAHDGAIVPTWYQPEMQCVTYATGELRCRCEGHTPVVDVTFSITASDLIASTAGRSQVVGRVAPTPASAAEKLRALVLDAQWSYSLDDHGDSAHDISDR